jgi:hypothetical protein
LIGGRFDWASKLNYSGGGGVPEASFLGSGSGSLYFLTLGVTGTEGSFLNGGASALKEAF